MLGSLLENIMKYKDSWIGNDNNRLIGGGIIGTAGVLYLTKRIYSNFNTKRKWLRWSDDSSVIIITGCDSGFGYSMALHAIESGGRVIATCYGPLIGNDQGMKDLEMRSENLPGSLHIILLDLSNEESIYSFPDKVQEILRRENLKLSGLINNAGSLIFAESEWQTGNQLENQFAVNVIGPIQLTGLLLPIMRENKSLTRPPRIVNILSFCTDCPMPTLSVYTATKAALKSWSTGLRMEVAKYGIKVVLFNPGDHPSETPLCANQARNYQVMAQNVRKRFLNEPRVAAYFDKCRDKFENLFKGPLQTENNSQLKLNNLGLYSNLDDMMLNPNPDFVYVNSDAFTQIFFGFLRILPSKFSDKLRILMLNLPDYHQ